MDEVLYEKDDEGYAIFTLNRPEALNAFNTALREQFAEYMEDFNADATMRVGIVTGAGRAFGVGADLKERARTGDGRASESARGQTAYAGQFGRSSKVFVAAVNGPCIAGAFEWTLDMDIRICTPDAYFGLFEVKHGMLASFGCDRLPQLIPAGEALYIALTGDRFSAEQALSCGLVHELVPREQLIQRAVEIASMILANHPRGVEGARAVVRHAIERHSADTRHFSQWVGKSVRSADAKEGARAFAEKREPVFEDQ